MRGLNRLSMVFVIVFHAGTVAGADSVFISTPETDTQILHLARFDSNGDYAMEDFDDFSYVYLQVYETDGVTVRVAVNAVPNLFQHTWTNPVNGNNESQLQAPDCGLGETKDFHMTAKLYALQIETALHTATRNLKVRYPVP
ncbi:MAG: hypothetical protein AB7I30_15910 [Isosphaeraceae bacterium]